jgi:hypothetical protein
VLARCPSCRNTFSTDRSGRQDCPICGKPLVVPEQPAGAAAGEAVSEPPGTPWERRAELGFIRAWAETVQLALFEPVKLFRTARLDRGAAQLGFAVLTSCGSWVIGAVLDRALSAPSERFLRQIMDRYEVPPAFRSMLESQRQLSPGWIIVSWLMSPIFAVIFLYLSAAVTHGFALLFGQAKRGFAATFAACAYACAPLVLVVIPACGGLIALVWLIVLTGVGLKEMHRTSSGGAAAAVLAPYAVLCCMLFVAGLGLAMTVQRAMRP